MLESGREPNRAPFFMNTSVSLEISPRRKALDATELTKFAQAALRALRVRRGEISILVTDDQKLKRLNRRFRGKSKPTDVLSFAASVGNVNPKVKAQLGDIAISADTAAKNARHYGHSLSDEIKVLILHGILHLKGYDHEDDSGKMERLEVALRRKLALPTSLIQRANSAPR